MRRIYTIFYFDRLVTGFGGWWLFFFRVFNNKPYICIVLIITIIVCCIFFFFFLSGFAACSILFIKNSSFKFIQNKWKFMWNRGRVGKVGVNNSNIQLVWHFVCYSWIKCVLNAFSNKHVLNWNLKVLEKKILFYFRIYIQIYNRLSRFLEIKIKMHDHDYSIYYVILLVLFFFFLCIFIQHYAIKNGSWLNVGILLIFVYLLFIIYECGTVFLISL